MSRVIGADEMLKDLQKLGDEMPQVEREMLRLGGDEMAKAWEQEIEDRGFISKGEGEKANQTHMRDSIKAKVVSRKGRMRAEITGIGQDDRGVRQAAKAYMLHYGTSRIQASHWIDAAEDHGMPLVTAAMAGRLGEALNNTIGGKGT